MSRSRRSFRVAIFTTLSIASLLAVALARGAPQKPAGPQTTPGYRVLSWNNLGMHCLDADFAVFSILPPFNVVQAQIVDPAGALVTSPAGLTVTYEAVADPSGSINTTSAGKTNFWDHVFDLFGASLPVNAGLAGSNMPGAGNPPQPMTFDPALNWFIAAGVPIVPYDDAAIKNTYPMMRISVRDATGTLLASSDAVLPVSDEMTCTACHSSGSAPAAKPAAGWVYDPDPQRDFRLNVLRLHDDRQLADPAYTAALGTLGYNTGGLYPTVTVNGTAILCARCHPSEALPGLGIGGIHPLTAAMHSLHANVIDPANGLPLDSSANRSACYSCHPGSTTRCLRGVMGNAVVAGAVEIQCQNCHGPMSLVGSSARTGWLMEPKCQSCHTGTAVTNAGALRYYSAFSSPGVERAAVDATFATNPDTPAAGFSLYRFSSGHGGLQCEACHGSTHAEYPSSHVNDNVQAIALQGHSGTIAECNTCHNPVPQTISGGPHGMHQVGQAWISLHQELNGGTSQCRNCHGTDYRGTVLSRSVTDRSLSAFGTKTFWRGFIIGCYTCHRGPSNDEQNPNSPPVVSDFNATTSAGVPVQINLLATDPNGDPLTLRIVSQPANGTAGLAGLTATYYPNVGFSGQDSFTYAARDGSTDSNLGHVTIAVGAVACSLTCGASAPAGAVQGVPVQFTGSATPSNCAGTPTYKWDFGDGSAVSTFQSPTHTYTSAGSFDWTLTTSISGIPCVRTGTITITAPTPTPTPTPTPATHAVALLVDPAADGGLSDGNGVLEPGESVFVRPSWKNVSPATINLSGVASNYTGSAGPIYTLKDETADYGSLGAGTASDCASATGNCYEVSVSNPPTRPSTHWDTTLTETLSTGEPSRIWTIHVGQSFSDVPKSHVFYPFIERILHNGVTTGCTPTTYCLEDLVSRLQMAAFIARAQAGGDANVPAAGTAKGQPYNCANGGTSLFSDVDATSPFCRHIHYIYSTNVTTGCEPGKYCPEADVTRAQMALFISRAIAGADAAVPETYGPDPVTARSYSCNPATPDLHFTDVTTSDMFCRHAHYLWARDIISGFPDGTYGPSLFVTRGAMAKFLANGFELSLYPP